MRKILSKCRVHGEPASLQSCKDYAEDRVITNGGHLRLDQTPAKLRADISRLALSRNHAVHRANLAQCDFGCPAGTRQNPVPESLLCRRAPYFNFEGVIQPVGGTLSPSANDAKFDVLAKNRRASHSDSLGSSE